MFQEEVREAVRRAYGALPTGAGRAMAERLYPAGALEAAPDTAVAWALGVGDPVRHAGLAPGEVVLDLGCGGGLDAVLAARAVGPTGRVVGLDLLPEMCERARAAAVAAGVADRCEFVDAEMESIPLPAGAVDVVISNGAVNLSPRKSRVLAEVARVLRPGGRVCLVDLAVEEDLPPEILASEVTWAGCIAGAVSERVLARKLERAGLVEVEIGGHTPFGLDDVATYPLFTDEVVALMRRLLPEPVQRRIADAVVVRATRPRAAPTPPARAATATTRTARLEDIAPTAPAGAPGVAVRRLKQVEDVSLKVLDVEADGATPYHRHLDAHEGLVVAGRGALRLETGDEPLEPGSVFSVRPNEPHAIVCRGRQPLRVVCLDCLL